MSYVGGPGFELYVPIEMARHVYLALHGGRRATSACADAGYYALDALRIEAGRRAWGAELGPDETPFEAGLAVRGQARQAGGLHRPRRPAARAARAAAGQEAGDAGLRSADAWAWGGEALLRRRRAGRRAHLRRLEPEGRRLRRPRLPARRRRAAARTTARRSRSTSGASASPPRPGTRPAGCSARRCERATAVLAALDRGAGLRAVAAVRHRRGRDPAGDRARRPRPRRLGRAGRAGGHADRHRLAGVEPAGVHPHHALRRALGDRRRRRLVRDGDGDLHAWCRTWPPSPSACS